MSSGNVYTGVWTDHSKPYPLGRYITLTVSDTQLLIGGTAAFITLVASSLWTIYAFIAHRWLATRSDADLMRLQHRSILRNDGSPLNALADTFWLSWWWKAWTLCPPRTRKHRARSVCQRSCAFALPAIIIFATFTAAGLLFSKFIATQSYRGSKVLLTDSSHRGECGIATFTTTLAGTQDQYPRDANNTRAAISYSRSCYSPRTGDLVQCSLYARTKLNYTTIPSQCPFGSPTSDFASTICAWNANNGAHRVATALLNTHDDLGINAPPEDRLTFQKEIICSPLTQIGFTSNETRFGSQANQSLIHYNYGAPSRAANATSVYDYNTASRYDDVPFVVFAASHNATQISTPPDWQPASAVSRSDADVTIVFVSSNTITYRNRVTDPFFAATYWIPIVVKTERIHAYLSDDLTSVMGCTEQYQVCTTPSNGRCTGWTGLFPLQAQLASLALNTAQKITAIRLLHMFTNGNIYTSINGVGPEALRMYAKVFDNVSPALPEDQWKREVEGWVETMLARWQAYIVSFARNTEELGATGHLEFPSAAELGGEEDEINKEWLKQCRNQKVSNLGGYQNVSLFGFVLTWAVGVVILVLSWVLKPIIFAVGAKWEDGRVEDRGLEWQRRVAWNLDGKLQAQRIGLRAAEWKDIVGGEDDVPYMMNEMTDLPVEEVITGNNSRWKGKAVKMQQAPSASLSEASGSRSIRPESSMPSQHLPQPDTPSPIPSGPAPPTAEQVVSIDRPAAPHSINTRSGNESQTSAPYPYGQVRPAAHAALQSFHQQVTIT